MVYSVFNIVFEALIDSKKYVEEIQLPGNVVGLLSATWSSGIARHWRFSSHYVHKVKMTYGSSFY